LSGIPSGAEVEARLLEASLKAGSLRPGDRLATKLDLSGLGVAKRLEEASDLLETCRALAQSGAAWRGGSVGPDGSPG
jgi:hypothetical protein